MTDFQDINNLNPTPTALITGADKVPFYNTSDAKAYAMTMDQLQTWVLAGGTIDPTFDDVSADTVTITGTTGTTLVVDTNTLVVDATNNAVGIGTITPLAPGGTSATLNVANSTLAAFAMSATADATDQKNWVWQVGSAIGAGTFRLRALNDALSSGENAYIITRSGTAIQTHQWLTANTERMRLDASGNLGLGVTPNTWASNYKALQIGGSGSLSFTGSGFNDLSLSVNAYFDAGDSRWEYRFTGDASTRYQLDAAGIHRWFTAPAGTAGNAITFTQAMTLDASGNLLVGLTSVVGSAKAAVAGTILSTTNTLSSFSGAYGGFDWVGRATRIFAGTADATNSQIEFYAGVSGSINERFRIKGPGQVRFMPLASAPTTNVEDGDVYYDSGTNKLRVRAGGAWVDLH